MNCHLLITAGFKNNGTYLRRSYYKQPFKLANITEDTRDGLLRLMMMSSSPGILDHDNFFIEIEVEENAKVHLTTQGYQRLFAMSKQASQSMSVRVQYNGSLCFLPHPNVPHEASNFSSVNNIYLSAKHDLTWSEIITCGRKLSGEIFKFTRFHNVTNVYIAGKLVVKENILLEPSKKNVHDMGQLEGYTHQSTLLFVNDLADMIAVSAACKEFLSGVEEITFGISMLPVNGVLIRILGQKGEQLFNCNNKLSALIQNCIHSEAQIMPGV
ncbi:MAG: urease accessory protein UreD [Ginsengibacter sp.]